MIQGHITHNTYIDQVSKIWSEKSNAEGDLEDVLETVELASRQVDRGDQFREFIDVILGSVSYF